MSAKREADQIRSGDGARSGLPEGLPYRVWQMRLVRNGLGFGVLCFVWLLGGWCAPGRDQVGPLAQSPETESTEQILYWTCSMHPQIKLPKAGPCPICFMDLVPVHAGGSADADGPELMLSPRARELARVQTEPVELRELTHEIGLVGKVSADETLITYISSYFPGRIDRLFVNYTGILVRKGDHLAEIYSPELLVAQREYVLALETADQQGHNGQVADMNAALSDAARRKLELWGVPKDEIESLAEYRRPSDHTRIDAPREGWVLERLGFEGMYVETGTRLFTLVDLRSVWVLLDAYEMDLSYVRMGQEVHFEAEAYPGQAFSGRVSYIDPILKAGTRTVNVRVNVPNSDMKLRPEMFVRARLLVKLGRDGAVLDNALAGKWVCYMHPEIVKDAVGDCDVCGMKLVTAESLGYAGAVPPDARALAVPQTAVLLTGKRAVAYVETRRGGEIVYQGREVGLGPRAGKYFIVQKGLSEGDRVVTHGALLIDSAMQIQAKPSMMQAESHSIDNQPDAPAAPAQIVSHYVAGAAYHLKTAPMIAAYLELTVALARDELEASKAALQRLRDAIRQSDPSGLAASDTESFRTNVASLVASLPDLANPSIEDFRTRLPGMTAALSTYLRTYGHDRLVQIVRAFCPMALNDKGAEWFQEGDRIVNPYFGAAMLRCGEIRGRINPDGSEVK